MRLNTGFTPPSANTGSFGLVRFRHPAYPDTEPDLLRLSPLDGGNGTGNGIQYDFALASCCIVTGNTFATGWLAARVLRGNGQSPVFHRLHRPEDGLLRDREYHFCVGEEDPTATKYPVIPSFDHWRFPHGQLPPPWDRLSIDLDAAHPGDPFKGKMAALARDGTCRISGYGDATETAHLVPLANGNWFSSNDMERYCRFPADPHPVNDERNLITLRRDLHHLLDTRRFTFMAKSVAGPPPPPTAEPSPAPAAALAAPAAPSGPSATAQLALHVMLPSPSGQLASLYHNRALQQPVRGVAVEFLFARFAWTLFTDENMPLLSGAVSHNVLLFNPDQGSLGEASLRAAEVRKHANIFETYASSSSRSVSPRKRSRPGPSAGRTDAEDFGSLSYLGVSDEGGGWDASDVDGDDDGDDDDDDDDGESDEEQWTRGRRRKRSYDASGRADDSAPPSLLGASSVSVSGASIATVPNELPSEEVPPKGADEHSGPDSKRPRRSLDWHR